MGALKSIHFCLKNHGGSLSVTLHSIEIYYFLAKNNLRMFTRIEDAFVTVLQIGMVVHGGLGRQF